MTSRIDFFCSKSMSSLSKPKAMPPCIGQPYSKASNKKTKLLLLRSTIQTQTSQDISLHLSVRVSHRAATNFHAIQHEIIRTRYQRSRLFLENFGYALCREILAKQMGTTFAGERQKDDAPLPVAPTHSLEIMEIL